MKVKAIIAGLFLAGVSITASAQQTKENPWFIQTQVGATYSTGNTGIGNLITPAGQISVGKYFNQAVGARLAVSGWRGESANEGFYYGAATVDGLFNLSTLFAGKNPERFFNASLIAGIGYNHNFAEDAKGSFMARAGLQGKIRLNSAFDLNLEALANGVSDRWNGIDDHNFDTYFSVLVGVAYKFGTGFNFACPDCDVVYFDNECYDEEYVQSLNKKINELKSQIDNHECPVPEPCPEVEVVKPGLKSHVLFGLAKTNITPDQEMNIKAIADYLNQYPEAKASVTGYADKGTGSAKINEELAKKRAQIVAEQLQNKYGISSDRLTVDSKGDVEQPFSTNDWNRVVIMIAE